MDRRKFNKTACAATIILLGNHHANSTPPFVIGAIIGAIAIPAYKGIISLINKDNFSNTTLQNAEKNPTRTSHQNWYNIPLSEELIFDENNNLASELISSNADNKSTSIGVINGSIYISRGSYSGILHSEIAKVLGDIAKPQKEIIPVPIKQPRKIESDKTIQSLAEWVGEDKGLSRKEYLENFTPSFITDLSSARRPTSDSADLRLITAINNKQKINGFNKIEVHAAPPNIG